MTTRSGGSTRSHPCRVRPVLAFRRRSPNGLNRQLASTNHPICFPPTLMIPPGDPIHSGHN
eukprot:1482248-Prorocentrum_lima.AAC.1